MALAGCAGDDDGGNGGDGDGFSPDGTVRYIVPYDEGGGTDTYARGIVEGFQDELGESIQIDNIPGAGGLNGLGELMQAEPDGQTIAGNAGPLEVAPQLLDEPPFDLRDLTGLGVIGRSTWCLVVNEEFEDEVETFDDVLEKYETGEWENVGVQSSGSSQDIIVLLYKHVFEEEVGWDWENRVQYTGTGPVAEATASGEVPCGIGTDAGTQSVVNTGRIYPVVTFFSQGTDVYPEIDSVTDLGYPEIDFVGGVWRGMYGPPELPQDIVDFYADVLERTTEHPSVQEWEAETGNPVVWEGPEVAEQNFEDAFQQFDDLDILELVQENQP
ncbi:MAG: tripartite tricarboxylate transporter substrate binding protein [Natronomonas sp.]